MLLLSLQEGAIAALREKVTDVAGPRDWTVMTTGGKVPYIGRGFVVGPRGTVSIFHREENTPTAPHAATVTTATPEATATAAPAPAIATTARKRKRAW